MEVLHYIKKRIKPAFTKMLFIYSLLISLTSVANEYRLDVLAQLPTLSSTHKVAVLPLPLESNNTHQYLFADDSGELSLLSGNKLVALVQLPLSNQANTEQVKLTALTLHPSFSLADKSGYQTFFTAHIEQRKTNNNVARLTRLESPAVLPFDAVITQWQYESTAPNKVDVQQRREVIRIAVPTATHQIQKIAFNPYSKNWHDDYGLLHIALADNKSNQSQTKIDVLYSGVVLRINPEKFGLRNYMVPNSNPFNKTPEINNEIFILGAQNISSFSWSKQHYDALLVQHTYDGAHQVVVAQKGADWRDSYQNKLTFTFKSNQTSKKQIFPYYGRKLKALVGNALYLANNGKNWQLAKLNTALTNSDDIEASAEQLVWSFNSDELPAKHKVALLFDHTGEPLLLDFTSKQLLSVAPKLLVAENDDNVQAKKIQDNPSEQPDTISNSAYGKLLLSLFILVLAIVFYRLRPKNNPEKAKLRSQFARFDLDDTQTTLSFYKRHQSKVDSQITVSSIVKSEVFLNAIKVSIINKDNEHGYNEQLENQLRLSFTQAHRHKLIDNEIREVDLYLTDEHNKTHVVCLYLRKGNQRLTKAKYFDALETLIDWSWFISEQLNPQATEKRIIKTPESGKTVSSPQQKRQTVNHKKTPDKEAQVVQPIKEKLHDIAVHDSELINALDKLASLKQKGFLTEDEFSLAKARILSNITDNK